MKNMNLGEDWLGASFCEWLQGLPLRFPPDGDCQHCRAPLPVRVLLSKMPLARAGEPRDRQDFYLSWYGLVLIAQALHRRFPETHQKWAQENFCPLPVEYSGFGCVRVVPAREILRKAEISYSLWKTFLLFFRKQMLRGLAATYGITKASFLETLLLDKDFREGSLAPMEKILLSELEEDAKNEASPMPFLF